MGSSYANSGETPNRVTAELVKNLAIAGVGVKEVAGHRPVFVVPDGFKLISPDADYTAPMPDHIRQSVELCELESFTDYVKQFRTNTTRIFATTTDAGAQFVAVLDYHEGGVDGSPKHTKHRASFSPSYSSEFAAWLAIHGKALTQEQFLEHLRKWGGDLTSHSDADLIEIASSLDFEAHGEFSSHTERTKGGRKLLFQERVEGSAQLKGKSITVPDSLAMKLPVFAGGKAYEISADILYRPQSGALKISIELKRHQLVVRAAVNDMVADVQAGTGLIPFIGSLK